MKKGYDGACAPDFAEAFCKISVIRDFPDTVWEIHRTIHLQFLSW